MVVKYNPLRTIRDHPFPKPSDRRQDVLMRRTARVGSAQTAGIVLPDARFEVQGGVDGVSCLPVLCALAALAIVLVRLPEDV